MEMKLIQHEVEEKGIMNKYGDGVAWFRGAMIGKGSFGSVFLGNLKKPKSKFSCFPSVMAVKSAEVSVSGSIQREKEVLSNLGWCNNVIQCFGEETTFGEHGEMVYNLLLEYGSGGTLGDLIKNLGAKGLPESDVKQYTRDLLLGISHIHDCGDVHCDLKPGNVLLVRKGDKFRVKIGDLGLANRANQSKKRKLEPYWRGTPMYMSPETVKGSIQECPSDIWALGCMVLEMLTGKPPWDRTQDSEADKLLSRIGKGRALPKIPNGISTEARKFLKACLVRKPANRLTAKKLLSQQFVEGLTDDDDDEEEEEDSSLSVLSDNEISCRSYYLSEDMNGESVTGFSKKRRLEIPQSRASSSITYELNHVTKTSLPTPGQEFRFAFAISAGV